jgi:hypothetical protein
VTERERRIRSIVVALLLTGCTPTPPEVSDTGLSGEAASGSTDTPTGSTTDGSATVASMDGTGTSSGGTTEAPGTTMAVDASGTTTGEPATTSGSSGSGTSDGGSTTAAPGDCHPLLAEVLYDAVRGNNNKQWVRLYNPCAVEIELADAYSLGWSGSAYTHGLDLQGSIDAGECRVVGGPEASNDNGNPVFDQVVSFSPDFEVGGSTADGVALFLGVAADIMTDTVPVDAVIYGTSNDNNLLDAEGDTPDPHVGNVEPGQSIRRTALAPTWTVEANPMPNACPVL